MVKLLWLAVLLTFSLFYFEYLCEQREFGRKRTTSEFYFKKVLLVGVFMSSLPDQTVFSFVCSS